MPIKPKYPKEYPNPIPFYGSTMMTSRKGMRNKTNYICTDFNCGYNSRRFITECFATKDHVSSSMCPVHRTPLLAVGLVARIPKKGSKERKKMIETYIKFWKENKQ